jgi:hypothetical protein
VDSEGRQRPAGYETYAPIDAATRSSAGKLYALIRRRS